MRPGDELCVPRMCRAPPRCTPRVCPVSPGDAPAMSRVPPGCALSVCPVPLRCSLGMRPVPPPRALGSTLGCSTCIAVCSGMCHAPSGCVSGSVCAPGWVLPPRMCQGLCHDSQDPPGLCCVLQDVSQMLRLSAAPLCPPRWCHQGLPHWRGVHGVLHYCSGGLWDLGPPCQLKGWLGLHTGRGENCPHSTTAERETAHPATRTPQLANLGQN